MSLVTRLTPKGPNGLGASTSSEEVMANIDLTGKTYLVTGPSSGIGKETVRCLANAGARVVAAGRDEERIKHATAEFSGDIEPTTLDLSKVRSIKGFLEKYSSLSLDGIVANAGIMALPQLQTYHGYEAQFFTNHIGHYLLITRLLRQLSPDARIALVSSKMH
ncbi:MAG: SDR family NAD(P)-dependent oxidoreductase, partial [Polyangiaceae bacterium]|nr:SDR family NAD(P)-dependent oxidoreductase [Polyangiaceae bacterium]